MNIDELFKKYPDNIFGFRTTNKDIKVIDFWIKKEWVIPEDKLSSETEIKQQKSNDGGTMIYYILYSATTTFLDLFNIVSNIIEYNLEIEKKRSLFEEKMNELKRIFMETNYDDLKDLQFDIKVDKLSMSEEIIMKKND